MSRAALLLVVVLAVGCQPVDPGRSDDLPVSKWWKGNLHTHSLWSDGNDFPDMIADWYASRGYHFLALSDHNILSVGEKWVDVDLAKRRGAKRPLERYRERFGDAWVETRVKNGIKQVRLKTLEEIRSFADKPGCFLMIQAEEITDAAYGRLPVHLNATHLDTLIEPQHGTTVRDVMRRNLSAIEAQSRALERPILGHLNHPNFGWAVTAEDLAAVTEERFFEVFNGHKGTHQAGNAERASVERIWDIANTIRIAKRHAAPLFGLATDDSHHYHGTDSTSTPGRGWVMVRAPRLEAGALVEAMQAGDFYASTGVSLRDVRFDRGTLVVEIEPAGDATFETRIVGTLRDHDARSELVRDAAGNPVRTTRRYSSDIGQTLATVRGTVARYRMTGEELYVRAVITSSRDHPDPSFTGQKQQAWTQPVGWRRRTARGPGIKGRDRPSDRQRGSAR